MGHTDACIYGRKIKRVFDSRLKGVRKKYDIKMIEVEILLYFNDNKGTTASVLYRELGFNKGQVSLGIDNLCKRNMLASRSKPGDRRYIEYELLPEGAKAVTDIKKEICDIYKTITEGIDVENQKQFFVIASMMCNNIDKYFKE